MKEFIIGSLKFIKFCFTPDKDKINKIKKDEYHLQFDHEDDGCWYIHLPNWRWSHHNLMMVAGADELCAILSNDDKTTKVEVVISNEEKKECSGYVNLERVKASVSEGGTYHVTNLDGFDRDIWLCQVTLFVLGSYPKYIYLKKED